MSATHKEIEDLRKQLEQANWVIDAAHRVLDYAGVPMYPVCDDPACGSRLMHRIELLIEERDGKTQPQVVITKEQLVAIMEEESGKAMERAVHHLLDNAPMRRGCGDGK